MEQYIHNETIKKRCVPDLIEFSISILKDIFMTRWDGNLSKQVSELYDDQANYVASVIRKYNPRYMYPKLTRI